ncbi:MAG: hypothetical protein P4L79_04050 [Legionella sp.]|uniref:hypothetical protein n=1 Tax=Legionella sp. TaxID=459 RepID=UPI00284A7CE4|nr:hypothetical protein [Legionella sp.]
MLNISNSIVFLWLLPVVLQIAIPLVILVAKGGQVCFRKIVKLRNDRATDVDFGALGSPG